MSAERWGILGGVFDPIHYAHLVIAEQVRDALALDRVLFVPAGVPVHRTPAIASADDRARMIELAIADNEAFELSRVELDAGLSGYSVDTVEHLRAQRPEVELTLIVSAESAAYLQEWRTPERLIDAAQLAVVPRLGYANLSREWLEKAFPGRVERFLFVETSTLGHSSSDVRARLAAGRSIRYLVPPAVVAYIREHGLYRTHEGADDRRVH